jgi:hypothetical protein
MLVAGVRISSRPGRKQSPRPTVVAAPPRREKNQSPAPMVIPHSRLHSIPPPPNAAADRRRPEPGTTSARLCRPFAHLALADPPKHSHLRYLLAATELTNDDLLAAKSLLKQLLSPSSLTNDDAIAPGTSRSMPRRSDAPTSDRPPEPLRGALRRCPLFASELLPRISRSRPPQCRPSLREGASPLPPLTVRRKVTPERRALACRGVAGFRGLSSIRTLV